MRKNELLRMLNLPPIVPYYGIPGLKIKRKNSGKEYKNRSDYKVHRSKSERKRLKEEKNV